MKTQISTKKKSLKKTAKILIIWLAPVWGFCTTHCDPYPVEHCKSAMEVSKKQQQQKCRHNNQAEEDRVTSTTTAKDDARRCYSVINAKMIF